MVDSRTIVLAAAALSAAAGLTGLLLESTARSEAPETRPATPPVIEGKPGDAAPAALAPKTEAPKAEETEAPKAVDGEDATPAPEGTPTPAAEGGAPATETETEEKPEGAAGEDAEPAGEAPTADAVAAKAGGPTGTWEASLAQREVALAKTQEALIAQLKRLEQLQAAIEVRWREADQLQKLAASRWTAATLTTPEGVIHLPPSGDERQTQLAQVAAIVKKMKPAEAAAMVAKWDDPLAVDVVARLSARSSSPVLAKMPPEHAARITRILARIGAPTPLGGDKK